jgi:peptidyl-prolyl cis-trans isomerase D
VVAAIRADRQHKAAEAAADALVKAAKAKGLAEAAKDAGLAVGEANDITRGMPVPSPQAAQAFFNEPRPQAGAVPVNKVLVNGQYLVYAVRGVRDADIGQVTPQERATLRQQLSAANGMQAQDAFVRAARAKYSIKVAEDRL